MSKGKPTPATRKRLRPGQARVTVMVERDDEPTLVFRHVVRKHGWSLDVRMHPHSMELTTTGKNKIHKGDAMTVDELSEILDRFHESLQEVSVWVLMRDPQMGDHPPGLAALDQAWRDLAGGLPAAEENATQIGKLQARVAQLEGKGKAMRAAIESELERVVEQPQEQNALRFKAPNGEFVDGIITECEWLTRPHQEFTDYETDLEPGVTRKAPTIWNCGTIRLVVRLTCGSGPGRSHEDSGLRSVTFISDAEGFSKPCKKCKHCGEWIRPENMGQECEKATK